MFHIRASRILPASTLAALMSVLSFLRADPPQSVPPQPADQAARLAWFHEAKFGLFIHWGLYSIPAGQWKGDSVPGIGEWIMNHAKIPVSEYEQLAGQFNPVKFDADAWVRIARDAGMRYLVITSKHHDGFALFQSKASAYNAVDATPFRRDIIKELADACGRGGMRLGFYYSQAQDWHEPNGAGNNWDFAPNDKKDFDQYLRAKAEPQVRELLAGYGPVCLIWFDTPQMMTPERCKRFTEIVRTLQPACLIDGRLGADGDYQSTGDNAIPHQVREGAWETPATINHTWGFKQDDDDWKSPGDIIFKLSDIVSKGGNYLLNVGPMSDGTIPPRCVEILASVGRWLKVNGDAIYGAGRTPFGDELGDEAAHLRTPAGKPVFLDRNDWRCTTSPGRLNFIVFKWPRDTFALPRFKNEIAAVWLLTEKGRKPLEWKTGADGTVSVSIPRLAPHPIANVICVEIKGDRVER